MLLLIKKSLDLRKLVEIKSAYDQLKVAAREAAGCKQELLTEMELE
jgi:hypothetical protein